MLPRVKPNLIGASPERGGPGKSPVAPTRTAPRCTTRTIDLLGLEPILGCAFQIDVLPLCKASSRPPNEREGPWLSAPLRTSTPRVKPQVRTCRRPPAGISGCTSRGWEATTTSTRSRSSPVARAPTSGTTTATATSTGSARSSAATPATAAPSTARPPRPRSRSSTSTPTGATRIRARSSSPSGSPSWRPATSTTSSSPTRARRRSSRRSRSPATGIGPTAAGSATRSSPARSPTTGPRWVHSPRPGSPRSRCRSSPRCRAARTCPNTNHLRWPVDRDNLWAAERLRDRIEFEGPETVAAVILEPLQNAGGCIPPQEGYFQRVREICDEFGVLLISDEVICSWGRLGHYFGAQRYDYQPDIITTAKALTGAYIPMGAMICSDEVFEPFASGTRVVRPRLDLRRPSGRRGGGAPQPRRLRRRGPLRPRSRAPRASSGRRSRISATSRSSATSEVPGTSTRSSSSRTGTRWRASTTTSRSGSCAASSRASCTGAA